MDINAKKITIHAAWRSLERRRVVWVMASLSVNGALLSIENKRYTCYCPRSEWWRSSSSSSRRYSVTPIIRCSADADSTATQKLGIKVDRNPPESRLTQLGVRNWPKYILFSLAPNTHTHTHAHTLCLCLSLSVVSHPKKVNLKLPSILYMFIHFWL